MHTTQHKAWPLKPPSILHAKHNQFQLHTQPELEIHTWHIIQRHQYLLKKHELDIELQSLKWPQHSNKEKQASTSYVSKVCQPHASETNPHNGMITLANFPTTQVPNYYKIHANKPRSSNISNKSPWIPQRGKWASVTRKEATMTLVERHESGEGNHNGAICKQN